MTTVKVHYRNATVACDIEVPVAKLKGARTGLASFIDPDPKNEVTIRPYVPEGVAFPGMGREQ